VPVLSSNDCLMKEPKDFTCLMLVGFKIISSRFVLLVLSKSLRKAFLKCSFSLQFRKKWFSSSRVSHLLHVRKCRGSFLYRPVSIGREWSLSLNLQINLLISKCWIFQVKFRLIFRLQCFE
jgi:hypothetical protein